jgi:protein O-mannosyl-transferase
VYISKNTDIKQFNVGNFFTQPYNATYVPLTMCSWAVDYKVFGLEPLPFIIVNILIHLVCTFLAYLLVKDWTKNNYISLVVMLLFGLHPIRVESVIWITERKDVLYTLFLFLALLQYTKHISTVRLNQLTSRHYFYTLLFFSLSLLSKGQAVILPVLLVCIDFLKRRKILARNAILEKVPFFFCHCCLVYWL